MPTEKLCAIQWKRMELYNLYLDDGVSNVSEIVERN
jgi:hypothetical protein